MRHSFLAERAHEGRAIHRYELLLVALLAGILALPVAPSKPATASASAGAQPPAMRAAPLPIHAKHTVFGLPVPVVAAATAAITAAQSITSTWQAAWAAPRTDLTYSVAWGDVDNDGDHDLALGNYGQPNLLYRNCFFRQEHDGCAPEDLYLSSKPAWIAPVGSHFHW